MDKQAWIDNFYEWLERKMKEHNISQRKLAEAIDVPETYMSTILKRKKNIGLKISEPIRKYIEERDK